jgi:hypothetical protein
MQLPESSDVIFKTTFITSKVSLITTFTADGVRIIEKFN